MADEKAKIVTDATGPGSGPAPAQPEVAAQVPKQEQPAPEVPAPDKAEAPAQEAPATQDKAADAPKEQKAASVSVFNFSEIMAEKKATERAAAQQEAKAPDKAASPAPSKEAEAAAKRLMENKFDMNDLLAQFQQVKKMGGASALLAMMPGGGQIDADSLDEKALPRIEAIIYSMTPAERAKPDIINPKRKRRIAAGSGTTVEDVNKLLRQFEMMQKMMKKVKRNPKGFMRSLGSLGGRSGGFRGFGR